MNREIKFRAWDGKEMHFSTGSSQQNNGFNYPWGFQTGLDEIEIMQYTGLHDKNGKEIYEGDILICYHNDYYDDGSTSFVTVIDFVDGSFWGINEDCCLPEDCEVVGNIYESPELIKTI